MNLDLDARCSDLETADGKSESELVVADMSRSTGPRDDLDFDLRPGWSIFVIKCFTALIA